MLFVSNGMTRLRFSARKPAWERDFDKACSVLKAATHGAHCPVVPVFPIVRKQTLLRGVRRWRASASPKAFLTAGWGVGFWEIHVNRPLE
jgi:hypothetical protein